MGGSAKGNGDLIPGELKRRKAGEKIVDGEEAKTKLVIFSLMDDHFAFYGTAVKEILPLTNIYFVPGSPDFILGVINIRGDIESVVSINEFLGLEQAKCMSNGRIALAFAGGIRSGILVDTIVDVVDVPVSSIKPPLSTLDKTKKDLIAGEATYKGRNVTLLDLGRIFGMI